MSSWAVVVPSNRPEQLSIFLDAWDELFRQHDVYLIVVWDGDDPPQLTRRADKTTVLTWADCDEWTPRNSDMIRSLGIYYAWLQRTDYTASLDDDVLPSLYIDLFSEYEKVFKAGAPVSDYLDVGVLTTFDGQMRGFPYRDREPKTVAIQYGGWSGVLDYDAATQLAMPQKNHLFWSVVMPVPRGAAVTGCAMNMAWRTEYAPIMWQLPLYEGKYNRFGDIWAGLIAKRVCDRVGLAVVVNGAAQVRHERASDPITNLEREQSGIRFNENLWREIRPNASDWKTAYHEAFCDVGNYFDAHDASYADHFFAAGDAWLARFK